MLLVLLMLCAVGVTAALVYGNRRWTAATEQLRDRMERARVPFGTKIFSPGELAGLPQPVQHYFGAALVDGLRMVTDVAIVQRGTFNQSEGAPAWKPFTAVQRMVMRRPGFFWDARIRTWPGVRVRVRDAYVTGEGIRRASVYGLFNVANLRDSGELAKAELMRLLAEAVWYPTALLPSQGVQWSAVDDHSARAAFSDGSITVSLLFRFNPAGLIESFRAEGRGRLVGGKVTSLPWEGRFWDYSVRSGMCVPLEGEVAWVHPTGVKPYWRGRVTGIDYEYAH